MNLPNRQSNRLKHYDYSRNGLYFITITTQNHEERFGKIRDCKMNLNDAGKMILSEWCSIPTRYPIVELDAFVVMPNHLHGIIILDDSIERVDTRPTPTRIGDIICAFKSITTNRYINGVKMGLVKPFRKRLWQRDYYDHIIRNEKECATIEQYIINNPQNWIKDRFRIKECRGGPRVHPPS